MANTNRGPAPGVTLTLARDVRNRLQPYYNDRGALTLPSTALRDGINAGLFLNKLLPDADWIKRQNAKQTFFASWATTMQRAGRSEAEATLARRAETLALLAQQGQASVTLEAEVVWRMVLGLGNAHPLETGLTLHPLYGFPFIPGSSVKGMTRHAALLEIGEGLGIYPISAQEIERRDKVPSPLSMLDMLLCPGPGQEDEARLLVRLHNDPTLAPDAPVRNRGIEDIRRSYGNYAAIFGRQERAGQVLFWDGLPLRWDYVVDVMTPHYGEYYMDTTNKVYPADWLAPTPIPFLTMGRGTRFCFAVSSPSQELATTTHAWLKTAVTLYGVGGKSGAGYGEMRAG